MVILLLCIFILTKCQKDADGMYYTRGKLHYTSKLRVPLSITFPLVKMVLFNKIQRIEVNGSLKSLRRGNILYQFTYYIIINLS